MTLSIGTMLTACRERAISEIDPMLPTDFVGFWWRDVQNSMEPDGTVKTWLPHGSYSNQNRTLIGFPGTSEKTPTYRNGWVESSASAGNLDAGFILSDRAGKSVLSPSLTMTRPDQTKLYIRFNSWLTGTNNQRIIYQTHWVDEETNQDVPGLTITQQSGEIRVSWIPLGWKEGTEVPNLVVKAASDPTDWKWIRVLFEKNRLVIIEVWNSFMTVKETEISMPFTSFLPAPATARHYVMRAGVDGTSAASLFLKDFGFGTDFDMPPEPRVTT